MLERIWWLVVALAGVFAGDSRTCGAEDAIEGDLKTLQGRWKTESFAGNPTTFTFKGRTLELENAAVRYKIAVTLDEKAEPEKTIDLKTEESTNPGAEGVTSPGIYKFEDDGRLLLCFRVRGERPAKYERLGFEQWRVELIRAAGEEPETPAAADSDAPLPVGWPGSTAPGRIEVKTYPAYRSAIVRRNDARADDLDGMFFPLFNHITEKNIAMTAPVVMTYRLVPSATYVPALHTDHKSRGATCESAPITPHNFQIEDYTISSKFVISIYLATSILFVAAPVMGLPMTSQTSAFRPFLSNP